MAPTKRKQALAESSDYTKKAKLMLLGGLEGIAGWFLKAPEIDQQRKNLPSIHSFCFS